jgi:sacsin
MLKPLILCLQVYNWTDNPSILSGSSLLILDPHETWSREVGEPGGPLYDFVQNHQEPEMINQLSPFQCLVNDFSRPFEGTIIRLPLRTADQASRSKIVRDLERKSTEIADIKNVFEAFSSEMAEYLLFLRHISSITLKMGDEVFAEAAARKVSETKNITNTFSIDEAYQAVLVRGDRPSCDQHFVMEITFRKKEEICKSRYAVTHHMRHKSDPKLQQWSRSYKLFPWAAIASPISEVATRYFQSFSFQHSVY